MVATGAILKITILKRASAGVGDSRNRCNLNQKKKKTGS